jgi:arginase
MTVPDNLISGPAFAPALIRESMWCDSTNSFTERGVDLNDLRTLVDVGNLPIQELRDCGVDDKQLFDAISSAIKIILKQVSLGICEGNFSRDCKV